MTGFLKLQAESLPISSSSTPQIFVYVDGMSVLLSLVLTFLKTTRAYQYDNDSSKLVEHVQTMTRSLKNGIQHHFCADIYQCLISIDDRHAEKIAAHNQDSNAKDETTRKRAVERYEQAVNTLRSLMINKSSPEEVASNVTKVSRAILNCDFAITNQQQQQQQSG